MNSFNCPNANAPVRYNQKVKWVNFTTRTKDLRIMYDTEADSLNTYLCEAPKSTRIHIERSGAFCDKEKSKEKISIRDNLLQVCVKDKVVVFDVASYDPKEVYFYNGTSQMISIDKFVESGIRLVHCYEDPSKIKDGYLVSQILSNRKGDIYYMRQDRFSYSQKLIYATIPRTPVCFGLAKKFAEIDLQEILLIQHKLKKQQKFDNIDMETVLSAFDEHTVFSIFSKSTKFHEQI